MATTTKSIPANKTLALLRQLMSDKRETQRELQEAFAKDVDLQQVVAELDKQYATRHA